MVLSFPDPWFCYAGEGPIGSANSPTMPCSLGPMPTALPFPLGPTPPCHSPLIKLQTTTVSFAAPKARVTSLHHACAAGAGWASSWQLGTSQLYFWVALLGGSEGLSK